MSFILYIAYAIAALALLVAVFLRFLARRSLGRLALCLVLFGLFWDNLILALGNPIGSGPLLLALSLPRFYLHQLFLPWIILTAIEHAARGGATWAEGRRALVWGLVASLALMVTGIMTRLVGLQLEPAVMDGVQRYVATTSKGPPLVSILGIGFLGLASFLGPRKRGWHWTWAFVALTFVIEGVPVVALRRGAGSAVELALMGSLLIYDSRARHS